MALVCEYCKCPQGSGRIDPGCPPNNAACVPCPPGIDGGILSILNSKLPGCEFNTRVAQWYSSTGVAKSVPRGMACPTGYTAVPAQSYMASDAGWQACGKNSATEQMPQSYADGLRACQNLSSPAPTPAPTSNLVCEYCKCPQGSGRIDPGCGPNNMMCVGCPPEINWFPIIFVIVIVLILAALGLYWMNQPKATIKNIVN
ncbi:hypothetical protein AR679_gp072 [Yellowstone lake phycodnavirus 1]|uniref:hypothetical protein n=1 Tax=Yellowstone lake phycodnavirus 1 TaxID=1586713 RepID=UPI0006EBDEFD|nr:hypothetical protein AR679_gp072 [Yellowstone lake phycodnavirus 1]BAT22098.1 hypothetical protein [Yellowstone lake phycodnavirus 1]